ncbi:MAG: serine/threonine-protein kinase [Eubacterium sp.]
MNIKEEYYLNRYEVLKVLSDTDKCKTVLERNIDTGELVIKKEMGLQAYDIYSVLKTINNKNLVNVNDCYETGDKCVAIEEYVNGKQLESLIGETGIPVTDAVDYSLQICDALLEIHKKGIIHRDIQPKNIIVTSEGVLKVIDFDIAREEKQNAAHDTNLFGTVGYASPEQYGFSQTDCRSDIYSVGIIMREMITGSQNGSDDAIRQKMLREKLVNNEEINIDLFIGVINRCTQIDSKNRYSNVEQLKSALAACMGKRRILKNHDNRENAEQKDVNELPELTAKNIVSSIPGFKTGNIIFALFSIVIYGMMIAVFGTVGSEVEVTGVRKIYSVVMYELLLIVPYIYLGNIGQIAQRFPRKKFKSKLERIVYQILYCIILVFVIVCIMAVTLPISE